MILQAPSMFEQYKMVMVVRADLKMGKGKVAAQVTSAVKKLLQCILFTYVSAYAHSVFVLLYQLSSSTIQCGHAAIGAYAQMQKTDPIVSFKLTVCFCLPCH